MKNVMMILLSAVLSMVVIGRLWGQEMGDKEKMKVFSSWVGRWQGEGSMQMGPGEPKKSTVDEHIEYRLDGMVMLVEGVGKAQGAVVHHALAVLSYDKAASQYKFRTYLKDGRSTDAWLNVTGENSFQWGFGVPGRKIRYTIQIDPAKKTWHEMGETSTDGDTWNKFFEMNLVKTADQ